MAARPSSAPVRLHQARCGRDGNACAAVAAREVRATLACARGGARDATPPARLTEVSSTGACGMPGARRCPTVLFRLRAAVDVYVRHGTPQRSAPACPRAIKEAAAQRCQRSRDRGSPATMNENRVACARPACRAMSGASLWFVSFLLPPSFSFFLFSILLLPRLSVTERRAARYRIEEQKALPAARQCVLPVLPRQPCRGCCC